ncbi:Na/Pi cotransporter family protein [Fulvivirga kasyanovii]|uniref:Na/Pi cotransporter family protein n=1 Tax=Fulvivirga kasyanovii TaxID=396812 RepID=A0ABW9RXE8_9BACT|nr:Na/Pi cotransporter family protein [Fulvivirga kasyanovii]MTI28435.1 Na/Pi cotransporter family protein [Fulvivirga kasyanovii]
MKFDFFDVLTLVGSLGFFIYGMKVMSEGIQKVAGGKMRQILRAMTSNRFMGVLTGFLLTSLVQSSSATTVMVVSFVNAGLLSLVESIGVIMGANIGTTVTAWIISIVGFKVKIAAVALPIIAFGFPLLFSSKNRWKSWGEVIIGFALLFMGLEALKSAVPDLKSNPQVLEFLSRYTDAGILSTLLFIAIGTVLTVVVQSSSASMALTLVMANQGWISFDLAAAMVLGENIGTTITANIAALVGNIHAKRAARAHFIFNIFGVVWMLLAFPLFLNGIDAYMVKYHNVSPFDSPEAVPVSLSIFHTTFNIINVLLLVWFVKHISKFVVRFVTSKGEDEEFRLEYISTPIMSTPEISLEEAGKEIAKFAELTSRMSGFVQALIVKKKMKARAKLMKRIKKYEEITDRVELEIADYLSKVSTSNLSSESSLRLRGMLSIINDLERIGDLFFQMSLAVERKNESDAWFSERQVKNLQEMFELIDEAFNVMITNLNMDYDQVSLNEAIEHEAAINKKRDRLRKKHLKNIEKGDYDIMSGIIYSDLYNLIERVGDHIINVSEAVTGELAKDEEDIISA